MATKYQDFTDGTHAPIEVDALVDSTGLYAINLDSLPQTLTYNGPGGAVDTITAGPDPKTGFSFRQTLTYTGSDVTSISAWVKL